MKKISIIHLSLIFTLAAPLYAGTDAGLPGEFLNFGAGARPLGMGRAFTGVADDVDAVYWNPAGLATFRSSQVSFQHQSLPLEGAYNYIAYAQPIYAQGSFGIGIVNVASDDIPRIDANNSEIGSFDHRETGYLASYAHRLGDKLRLGGTLKMAEKSTDGRSKKGFGMDSGILYQPNERISFGGMLRNLVAPAYKYGSEKEEFPTIMRLGGAVKFFNNHLTTALDIDKTIGTSQSMKYHLGVEGNVIENIFLRAGWDKSEISTGLGLKWRSYHFDYAAGFQDVGLINRFTVKIVFGGYEIDVKASPRVFSPVGLKNKVTFKVRTTSRSRIVKWIMTIRNAKDEVVQSYQGFDRPPEVLEWDGKDTQGNIVEAGRYTYRMMITDANEQVEKTPVRSIRILAPTPFEIEAR